MKIKMLLKEIKNQNTQTHSFHGAKSNFDKLGCKLNAVSIKIQQHFDMPIDMLILTANNIPI